MLRPGARGWAQDQVWVERGGQGGGWGTQLRPCLTGFRCGQDGRLHPRRGLCAAMAARQAGGDRDDSLVKPGGAGGGADPAAREGSGWMEALFLALQTPRSGLPWAHSFPSFVQTSAPWGWVPNP
uniref:Uncharacterized protein n=1 Tax=Myotis myotis TaxID=51298 RepID=A0A7J7VIP1_MYOMY|nr:hypothetical protein mMyoMyo1_008405 [Myotis myotis]